MCALVTRRGLRFRHAGHHAGLPGERAVRRAGHRGRVTQPSGRPDGPRGHPVPGRGDLHVQGRGVAHALEQAPGRPAGRRGWPAAQRVGLTTVGRARSADDDRDRRGSPGGAMLAHRARLSTSEAVKLVSEVTGTKSGARQAAMVKNIEATVYIDRIRELARGIMTSRPGRGRGPKPRLKALG